MKADTHLPLYRMKTRLATEKGENTMKKVIRRILAVLPAVVMQGLWIWLLFSWLAPYATVLSWVLTVFAVVLEMYILTSREEVAYRTLWLIIILSLPVAGAVLYLCVGNKRGAKPIRKKLEQAKERMPAGEPGDFSALETADPRLAQTFRWVGSQTGFPVMPCEGAKYYPLGEDMHPDILSALESAQEYIYVEYFNIEDGKMWDPMVEIMARKAAQGVDVRVMYDDLGSIATYSVLNVMKLRELGIHCFPFNPMLYLKGTVNYRDHRKMLIVDGKVAFSGGVNLADEYINAKVKFGHWKDIGFRLTGAPVGSYTRMFTEFWNAFSWEDPITRPLTPPEPGAGEGCVLSYYDSPLYREPVSNTLYVELLSQAVHTAWFFTPYLMLGEQLMDAFTRAAGRGVDVRIIMPGIPDKKIVYRMSRSYYRPLLEAGVKIYEYTPGFVHAKGCVIDGEVGTIGTVNLDYRSLFLHFENNSLFYRVPILKDLAADYTATQEKCREVSLESRSGFWRRMVDGVLRLFAPLC